MPSNTRPTNTRPNPIDPHSPYVTIRPWVEPVVDARGHDPRSAYVERYWLGVIGPTAGEVSAADSQEFRC